MEIQRRLLAATSNVKYKFILAICLGVLGGILGILQAFGLSKVIDRVFLQNGNLSSVSILILLLMLIVLVRAASVYGSEFNASAGAAKIKQDFRQQIFARIYSLGPAYLQNAKTDTGTRTGELVNLATEGIDALEAYYSQYLPQVVLAILIPFSILIVVVPTDLLSGIILLVTAPLLPIFMYLIGSTASSLTRKQWVGLNRMSAYFLDVLQGLTTLKSLGRSKDQIKVIEKVSDQYRQTTMSVLKLTFLSSLALELIATLSTAVLAVEIGIRLLYGKMAFEQAFFILLLAPEFYLPLRSLGTKFHASMAGLEAAKQIFGVLDTTESVQPVGIKPEDHFPQSSLRVPPSITINDIKFCYQDRPPTLDSVSFDIPGGKITAITGPSGAGKTTLTWLLLRFLRPQGGKVLVEGKSLDEIPADEWYTDLAWVSQRPYLFDDTIAANIILGRPAADMAAVKRAAYLAHADEFIDEMPNGYKTVIGERGTRLSAGQAQRIALARAFLKDAPLLIMDEATSHLDPITDAQLQESIQRLVQDRTVVVIAHRKTTLAMADQVISINRGKIETIERKEQAANLAIPAKVEYPLTDMIQSHSPKPSVKPINELPLALGKRSSLIRLIELLAPFWPRILLSVFLGFATIASGIGLMATSAYIISAAALHPSIAELEVAIVGVRFFGLSRGVFRYLERLVSHDVTFRLLARWRVRFYQALEPLAPARLHDYHSGDLLTRVIRDIGTLENFYVRTVNPPLVALLVGLSTIVFLGKFGNILAWGLLAFLALGGIGLPLVAYYSSRLIGHSTVQAKAKLNTLLVDSIQGMPDLLTNGRRDSQLRRISQAGEELSVLQSRMSGAISFQAALGTLLAHLGMLTVLVLAVELVTRDQLNSVLLGVVSLTVLTCFEAILPLPQVAQNLEANQASAERLYELVDTPNPVEDPAEPSDVPESVDLQVQDLSFEYPATKKQEAPNNSPAFSLNNISLSLTRGKHIAILGQSGAGKTTLTNLLQRFWEYREGSIAIGGKELRVYCQDDIRKLMATISQDTYLFCATIKDNLLIARPSATYYEIRQSAYQAQLDEFIQSLPEGYDTWIGEHGLRLSTGERQRLAVARAFIKDAPILILDEPTANLDPDNEKALLSSINQLSQGRSVVLITQNMVGLEAMDEIMVMHDGQIAECGNHHELFSNNGIYRQMWDLYHQIV